MYDELMFREDYQTFAEKYLGIDLEDYVELLGDIELTESELDSEYEMSM